MTFVDFSSLALPQLIPVGGVGPKRLPEEQFEPKPPFLFHCLVRNYRESIGF
jgi:hypothetical protein